MAPFAPPNVEKALEHPIETTTDDRKFAYDTTSQAWKDACAPLPSSLALQWPGYATTAIETTLSNGRQVVIQPWMGHCQRFFGSDRFPGGFGGEVGVYVKAPRGRPIPDSKVLHEGVKLILQGVSALGGDRLWWPDPEVQPEIEFTIINPLDNSILVRATKEKNYWVNKWMQPQSYEAYRVQHHVPSNPIRYKMVFTVDNYTRSWMPSPTDV